ncbi:unnamed protein product [Rhizoctonia solani]|uniref:Fungal-specific transcription factor domain protein n=1 Tax=Rhizoctonia solani TaxID=456999 RepID=A0A8H2XIS3_9AGAM|nr:unnamed protein product [Rhizoctonia solani]CAE6444614.1 unnamed protein product [Rhizoctonia solani]
MACHSSGTDCLVCQARGTDCRCVEPDSRNHWDARTTYSRTQYAGETSSGLGTRGVTPIYASLSPPVDALPESLQAESVGHPQAAGNFRQTGNSFDSSPHFENYWSFQDENSYHFSRQHQVTQQLLSPPYSHHDRPSSVDYHSEMVMPTGREHSMESMFSLTRFDDQLNWEVETPQSPDLIESPDSDEGSDDFDDPENVQSAVMGFLSLDRNVENDGLSFILKAHATWISRFLFEPLQVVHFVRHGVFRCYALGEESRQILNLLAMSANEITRSADYDPELNSSLPTVEAIIRQRLTDASNNSKPSRELDRQYTLGAMLYTHELISAQCVVGSLSSVISLMQLAAPVFRRACPDSLEGLVNLPSLFKTMIVSLQYYSTMDVLLGVLTGRPMFFRYDVEFRSDAPESIFLLEDAPGTRWLYGVPDRLLVTFAQMNGLLEDFGSNVQKGIAEKLEMEIKEMKPIVGSSTEPILSVGRTVVQECWFLAALIYLHMGLCGADSADTRVVKVRAEFIKIIASVRPKRHPDSFLVLPMVILGLATDSPNERSMIRRRLLRVSECSRPGTMGNDFVRILDNVWSNYRPIVWSDLRRACWEVSGV